MNKKFYTMILGIFLILAGLRIPVHVSARSNEEIGSFIGYYLCGTADPGDINSEATELSFNGDGQLMRYKGLRFSTTGTSIYYNYTKYEISGNVLTCYYDGAYGYYGEINDIGSGIHQFTLLDDGNLAEEERIWYRYQKENEESHPHTLLSVTDIDFSYGNYSKKASFLGNTRLSREQVEKVTFLDEVPENIEQAWDVSYDQDGSVKAWIDRREGICHVYIASEGGVTAGFYANDLFRLCTNLKMVEFNGAFDTRGSRYMEYMFAGCEKLETIEGIEAFYTVDAYSFDSMFADCTRLKSLNLDNFVTAYAHNMRKIFYHCSSLQTLSISNFTFQEDCDHTDIYTGTKWEGSSPQFENDTNYDISITYILNFDEIEADNRKLKAKIVNSYDAQIEEFYLHRGLSNSDELQYSLLDITGDGVQELFILISGMDTKVLHVYTFNIETYQAEELNAPFIWPSTSVIMYATEKNAFAYYDENILTVIGYEDNRLVKQNAGDTMDSYETMDFNYVIPEIIQNVYVDIDGDEAEENIKVCASKTKIYYNYILMILGSKAPL